MEEIIKMASGKVFKSWDEYWEWFMAHYGLLSTVANYFLTRTNAKEKEE